MDIFRAEVLEELSGITWCAGSASIALDRDASAEDIVVHLQEGRTAYARGTVFRELRTVFRELREKAKRERASGEARSDY
ncbi:unnamed protein product, partial [Sphacelaria rigidula]